MCLFVTGGLALLEIPWELWGGFSYFCSKLHWDFDRGRIDSVDCFG